MDLSRFRNTISFARSWITGSTNIRAEESAEARKEQKVVEIRRSRPADDQITTYE